MNRGRLVSLRVNILRHRSVALVGSTGGSLTVLKKLQTSLDVNV